MLLNDRHHSRLLLDLMCSARPNRMMTTPSFATVEEAFLYCRDMDASLAERLAAFSLATGLFRTLWWVSGESPKTRDWVAESIGSNFGGKSSVGRPEPVTDPCLGQNVLRARRIRLDLVPKLAHIDAQILGVDRDRPEL